MQNNETTLLVAWGAKGPGGLATAKFGRRRHVASHNLGGGGG